MPSGPRRRRRGHQPITNPDWRRRFQFRLTPEPAATPEERTRRAAIESGVPRSTASELLVRAATQPIRILVAKATEGPDFSSQRLRCKILRNDVADGALALIFAVAALSFDDARPRGTSDLDYVERDRRTVDDLCRHLHFEKGTLHLDTDYVRGRMMKTSVTVWPSGIAELMDPKEIHPEVVEKLDAICRAFGVEP